MQEKIADFVGYNTFELTEMKKNAPELFAAVQSVIKELGIKYGSSTEKLATKTAPKESSEIIPFYLPTTREVAKIVFKGMDVNDFLSPWEAGRFKLADSLDDLIGDAKMEAKLYFRQQGSKVKAKAGSSPQKIYRAKILQLRDAIVKKEVNIRTAEDGKLVVVKDVVLLEFHGPFTEIEGNKLKLVPLSSSKGDTPFYMLFCPEREMQKTAFDRVSNITTLLRLLNGEEVSLFNAKLYARRVGSNGLTYHGLDYIGKCELKRPERQQVKLATNSKGDWYIIERGGESFIKTSNKTDAETYATLNNMEIVQAWDMSKPTPKTEPTPKKKSEPKINSGKPVRDDIDLEGSLLEMIYANGSVVNAYVRPNSMNATKDGYEMDMVSFAENESIHAIKTYLTSKDIQFLLDGESTMETEPSFTPIEIPGILESDSPPIVIPEGKYPSAVPNNNVSTTGFKRSGPTQSAAAYAKLCSRLYPEELIYFVIEPGRYIPFIMYGNDGQWWYLKMVGKGVKWTVYADMTEGKMRDIRKQNNVMQIQKTSKMSKEDLLKEQKELIETLSYFDSKDPEYKETQAELAEIEEKLKNLKK